ncbi:MAG: efflux transporter periplasmic adaptor subunit [Candidatus Cloacimonetes bacterium HGW-Cloacimonetes-2]|jgi:RND family efflux transporter MFP subunit|nr:MAG: efflux transporter periplasmic adaptor subunit [Candidatus Cloacimonetes bacterium HGW-Cloacimonetes-2]
MKKKNWLWLVLAIVLALIVWRFITGKKGDETRGGRGPQAVAVELAPVEIRDLDEVSNYSGNLRAYSSFVLAPKVSGQLTRLHVNIGDRIRKGQLIAELEDVLIRHEHEKALANLNQATSAFGEAQREVENTRQLLEREYISQGEYDAIYARFISEQSKLQVAQAAERAARFQLEQTRVIATWDGPGFSRVVGERFAVEGQLLSAGSPLVSILDISRLVADIEVIEADYRKIRIGQAAKISSDAWPQEAFAGRVARIAPILQEQSRQARVEIELPNPSEKLKPGMFIRVRLVHQSKQQVTVVPEAALYKHKGVEGVFVVNRDSLIVNFLPVETGISSDNLIEILSPSLSGEVVILGQDQLDEGSAIILPGRVENKGTRKGSPQ